MAVAISAPPPFIELRSPLGFGGTLQKGGGERKRRIDIGTLPYLCHFPFKEEEEEEGEPPSAFQSALHVQHLRIQLTRATTAGEKPQAGTSPG